PSPAQLAQSPIQNPSRATNESSSSGETGASGSASSPGQPANAERGRYGEPASSGGPSGRTCHHDWPARASQSTNRYASSPSRPPGSDVGWSKMPLDGESYT